MGWQMSESEIQKVVVQALRKQRHDFINHLQVIHGLLQLGKGQRALDYIDELAKDPRLISDALEERPSSAEEAVTDGNQRR